jgi:hypothetical protein
MAFFEEAPTGTSTSAPSSSFVSLLNDSPLTSLLLVLRFLAIFIYFIYKYNTPLCFLTSLSAAIKALK